MYHIYCGENNDSPMTCFPCFLYLQEFSVLMHNHYFSVYQDRS
jgi:hypothetical protein